MQGSRVARIASGLVLASLMITACVLTANNTDTQPSVAEEQSVPATPDEPLPTAMATREAFAPGTLVDYIAQTGDTLPALAAHFNTSEVEIREANPIIPGDATTMPPGFPMKIPIYYRAFWGSSLQIIPDRLFINGPAQINFDAEAFVKSQPGWFKDYVAYLGNANRRGGEIVNYIATLYSVSPRLLLAILEYQTGALSNAEPPANLDEYPLGYRSTAHTGVARQLIWAANRLNNGYYGWRTGDLIQYQSLDGRIEAPDPWQNAASVGISYYFAGVLRGDAYTYAVSGDGFRKTYAALFGDPWVGGEDHMAGSLRQPEFRLPFSSGDSWAFTGGPHTGWGEGEPLAALDFAPPAVVGGCSPTEEFTTAVAAGIVARTGDAQVVLDLDGDGDERTGWVVFYLHVANASLPAVGTILEAGAPIGLPSCEGGRATGTHVHIARKYNGEWIPADGALAFNMEGWIAHNGATEYEGTLSRSGQIVRASVSSDNKSQIQSTVN